jgi:hypothetical protein
VVVGCGVTVVVEGCGVTVVVVGCGVTVVVVGCGVTVMVEGKGGGGRLEDPSRLRWQGLDMLSTLSTGRVVSISHVTAAYLS